MAKHQHCSSSATSGAPWPVRAASTTSCVPSAPQSAPTGTSGSLRQGTLASRSLTLGRWHRSSCTTGSTTLSLMSEGSTYFIKVYGNGNLFGVINFKSFLHSALHWIILHNCLMANLLYVLTPYTPITFCDATVHISQCNSVLYAIHIFQ